MDKAIKALEALEALDRLTDALVSYEDFVCDLPVCVDVEFRWEDVDLISEALEQLKGKE